MKILFAILIHIGIVLYVRGEYFEFVDSQKGACILLNISATFNLTHNAGNETEVAELFDLDGATVVNSSSLCGDTVFNKNSILTVRLFPSGEELQFTFKKQFSEIQMRVALFLKPETHFSDMNNTLPVEMKDYMDLRVGSIQTSNNSYECHSEQDLRFIFNFPFLMTMTISNIKAQAFNVRNDTFGPAIECKQDSTTTTNIPATSNEPSNVTMTTVPVPETTVEPENATTITPTLEPETTITNSPTSEVPTESTSPELESTTKPHTETSITTVPATTEPQPPEVPTFVVKNKDTVCIVLEGKITFEIKYQKTDNTTGTAQVSVPYNANAGGNCQLNSTAEEITLKFFNSTWVLDVVIMTETETVKGNALSGDEKAYTWQYLKLSYVVDKSFINAKLPGSAKSAEASGIFGTLKSNTEGSYKCTAEQSFVLGNDVQMKLSQLQYRAFGNTNSADFTKKDVLECAADSNNNGNGVDNTKLGIILGCVFGGLAVIILAAGGVWYKRRRKYEHL